MPVVNFCDLIGLVQAVGCDKQPGTADTAAADAKAADPADSATAEAKPSAAGLQPFADGTRRAGEDGRRLPKRVDATKTLARPEFRGTDAEHANPRATFPVAFQRPNKLRHRVLQGEVVCDGKKWFASCEDMPGQAVLREAPAKLKLDMLRADSCCIPGAQRRRADRLAPIAPPPGGKVRWRCLVAGSQEAALWTNPARMGDYDCYRVRFNRSRQAASTGSTGRPMCCGGCVPPVGRHTGAAEGDPTAEGVRLVANFERARLGGESTIPWPSSSKCPKARKAACPRANRALRLVGKKSAGFQVRRSARQAVEQPVAGGQGGRAPLLAKRRPEATAR